MSLIGICLTYNCQLRCNYCSYSSVENNEDLLESKDILAFVTEAIKRRTIHNFVSEMDKNTPLSFFFTGGGEPTYNWNLFEKVVVEIKNKCQRNTVPYHLELTTNGMLNNHQRKFIKEHFNKIMVSYDGMPEIQNKNRNNANHIDTNGIVEDSIKYFIDSSLFVTIRSTVWDYDFARMKDMCDYIGNHFNKVNEWSIMPIIPSGRAVYDEHIQKYDIDNYNFFNHYVDLVDYAKQKYKDLYISSAFFKNTLADFCCGATFTHCYWIMPNKSIINCIEAERFKVPIGKITNERVEFLASYHDTLLNIVRKTFTECRSCLAYRFCKGGCPLKYVRDDYYNTKYRQYECSAVKQYWEYAFDKILSGEDCFGWHATKIQNKDIAQYNVLQLTRVGEEP